MTTPTPAPITRRRHFLAATALAPWWPQAFAADAAWDRVERTARGQTVYFNAWAGSENINAYLQWAGGEVEKRWGVKL